VPRDSEASAPAEFPPEQPEADLVADEDEYGAEELAEEEEELVETAVAGANGEEIVDKDAAMDGVEAQVPEPEAETGVEEDEMSDDGSVDIEGESEDDLEEEEEEGEGEAAEGDEMDVDMDKPEPAAGPAKTEVMVQ